MQGFVLEGGAKCVDFGVVLKRAGCDEHLNDKDKGRVKSLLRYSSSIVCRILVVV